MLPLLPDDVPTPLLLSAVEVAVLGGSDIAEGIVAELVVEAPLAVRRGEGAADEDDDEEERAPA